MKGGSLKNLIIEKYNSNSFFRDEDCALIIRNILEGLHYLHSMNIIHRDIKPENIMLKDKNDLNSIKIGDFGFSTILNENNDKLDCGTVIYMSPEIHGASESSDIWACGFILYILASGGVHPLYKSGMSKETYQELLASVTEWKFPDTFPM
jgi:serine/threonine protein kinase